METITINIKGMTCMGCVRSVKNVLEPIAGVSGVDISLDKGQAAITYDPATKMFVRGMFDNMGGWGQDRSKGWEGDKMEFAGTSKAMGQDFATKETITKTGPKAVTVAGTMTMGGKPFGSWDMACKK